MEKICKALIKPILSILAFVLILIISRCLIVTTKVIYDFNFLILMVMTLAYLILIILISKKLIQKLDNYKWIPYFIFGLIFIVCITFAFYFKVTPSWDFGCVFREATNIANKWGRTLIGEYLYVYPNNALLTLFWGIVFKISNIVGLSNNYQYQDVALIVNSLIICATIICLYFSALILYGSKKALLALFIALLTTPIYLYSSVYYSDTMSMFLSSFLLLLLLIYSNKEKSSNFQQILIAFVIFLSCYIKITASFILIAYILYSVFNKNIKEITSKLMKKYMVCIVCFILLSIGYNALLNKYMDQNEIYEKKFPITHWIMMGLHGQGGYDEQDILWTKSFVGIDNKNAGDIKKINELLRKYNFWTFTDHLLKKLDYTWQDGSYFVGEKLRRLPVHKGIGHKFILSSGKYSKIYSYFPQTMHIGMLIFIVINIIFTLKKGDFKNKDNILFITIFGTVLFLLLWETRSRYLLTILPFLILAQINGIYYLSHKDKKLGVS